MLRKRESDACGTPVVGAMVPEFCRDRYILLSVNGFGEKQNVIDRFRVTFDKKEFSLVCNCSSPSKSSEYNIIAKWYLRTAFPDVFSSGPNRSLITLSLRQTSLSDQVERELKEFTIDFSCGPHGEP